MQQRLKSFHIAALPITFAQFRAFVDAEDGYDDERWWKDLMRNEHGDAWQSVLANHPVTDVSWHDATAFCRWLSARLKLQLRLPDEQEWQWAAQSAQPEFVYPWGSEWGMGPANTNESDIHGTTAVGVYPDGDSLQKVSDLAGNVWEWCRNVYEHPAETEPGGKGSRVLRGGSWNARRARARGPPQQLLPV